MVTELRLNPKDTPQIRVDIGICGKVLLFHQIHRAKAPFFLYHQGIRRRFSAKAGQAKTRSLMYFVFFLS